MSILLWTLDTKARSKLTRLLFALYKSQVVCTILPALFKRFAFIVLSIHRGQSSMEEGNLLG